MVNRQSKQSQSSTATHRSVQSSSTLNRRYVRRPSKITIADAEPAVTIKTSPKTEAKVAAKPVEQPAKATIKKRTPEVVVSVQKSARISRAAKVVTPANIPTSAPKMTSPTKTIAKTSAKPQKDLPAQPHHFEAALKRRSAMKSPAIKPSNKDIKEQAIKQALRSVATMEQHDDPIELNPRKKSGALRFFLAFICASACVVGIIAYVSNNVPDISVHVAAMQTGIEASYPAYVPRDYSLSNIASEEGKLTMTFQGPDESGFVLTEEKSSWDSAALLRNFIEPNWRTNYITTHEQGITIYINTNDSDAAWVNGGVLYKIEVEGQNLTKKQIRNIVLSL